MLLAIVSASLPHPATMHYIHLHPLKKIKGIGLLELCSNAVCLLFEVNLHKEWYTKK
jgi:hypothetical protein